MHHYYNQLTEQEREAVDQMAADCFTCAREDYDISLAGDDRAEWAVDALARWMIESRGA